MLMFDEKEQRIRRISLSSIDNVHISKIGAFYKIVMEYRTNLLEDVILEEDFETHEAALDKLKTIAARFNFPTI